jgi:acyl-CoA synthetase (AMP-forming)/AMP-acid ligase II
MLSHAQIMAGSRIVSTYLEIGASDRTLAALPFSFDAGMNQLMTAMEHGATVVIKPFVFARELVKTLVEEEITGMGAVPPLWSLMAQPSSGLHKNEYPHLRYISNTGGAMPLSVLESLRKSLPTTKVFLMYGLTEAFRSTYLPPEEVDRRPTSMGKAIPDTEILVVDEEGKPVAPGEAGELVHRGPTVSMGYSTRADGESPPPASKPSPSSGRREGRLLRRLVKRTRRVFTSWRGGRDDQISGSASARPR